LKLNCDLGELQHGNDEQIMPYIDQANIACGFHASDPLTMLKTVQLAVKYNVSIGAHPSYPDKENFGRRSMSFTSTELIAIIHYQIGALQTICHAENTTLSHVKPHGALYNDMMANMAVFGDVCHAVSLVQPRLPLMIQALPDTSQFITISEKFGVALIFEAFADRVYQENGLLVPRSQLGAVLHDEQEVLNRIMLLNNKQQLLTINNNTLDIKVDSLCVHGDNPAALALIKALRVQLDAH